MNQINFGENWTAKLRVEHKELGFLGEFNYSHKTPSTLHFVVPFYYPPGELTVTLVYTNLTFEQNSQFNLSEICMGQAVEELTLSKKMTTSYTRTHKWSIDKTGDPEVLYLYISNQPGLLSEGTVNYTLTVNYEGYEDSGFKISGTITIENIGGVAAVITKITDVLAGMDISDKVDWGVTFPYTLAVGKTLKGTFEVSVSGKISGDNVVTVTTERDTYEKSLPIPSWDEPTTEIDKTVRVKDAALGIDQTFTAPNGGTINASKMYKWEDFVPGTVNTFTNTAFLLSEDPGAAQMDTASFTVTIYVQGWVYETAYAKGVGAVCFIPTFSNWGWTNPVAANAGNPMDLWAAAGQCDTWRGIKVGTVTVYANGEVKFDVALPYKLAGSSVYVGPDKFPKVQQGKKTVETVAPGQYYLKLPYDWVIVHAQVGIPDPKFGP